MKVLECLSVPKSPPKGSVLKLLPKGASEAFYWERVDRNLGWLANAEQAGLKNKVIGIAGCGGMGGMLAQVFFRLGVGEVRIADPEVFDTSNLNRQFAASRKTIGKSKAVETARATRAVLQDG